MGIFAEMGSIVFWMGGSFIAAVVSVAIPGPSSNDQGGAGVIVGVMYGFIVAVVNAVVYMIASELGLGKMKTMLSLNTVLVVFLPILVRTPRVFGLPIIGVISYYLYTLQASNTM